ncbi:protein BREAST CANCER SUSCEPTIBILITY 1 [Dorcoceras hygrometricum]|uniref:Protein BREAST CANCER SUSCEPTIBILITY 1 n=1 Tax=Dorcoceras hygrometricum TaxID=472368 RepID=A0A2Z7BJC1_9LAMI|nr:protein BREAST CANCER SUSCEPTIBILITY 1 [Dorcoceras hygrometricum]
MVWTRCLNGTREQASNTVALDENNRAKLVKDEPARRRENRIGRSGQAEFLSERWTQESVIVNNVDAYDDVKTEDHMPSDTKGIVEEDSYGERSNQLGRKPAGKQGPSQENIQVQERTEQE